LGLADWAAGGLAAAARGPEQAAQGIQRGARLNFI